MSRTPYLLERARWGYRMGNGEVVDGMTRDGFFCPIAKELMANRRTVMLSGHATVTGEVIANRVLFSNAGFNGNATVTHPPIVSP